MKTDGSESQRIKILIDILREMESAVIAFSGGADSSFLLKAAALAGIKVLAVTGFSPTMSQRDFEDAKEMAAGVGVPHVIIETHELGIDEFRENPPDRCYYCKDELFRKLKGIASSEGYRFVLDGSNLDDLDDWRPGRRAAVEHGVRSPLVEAALRKEDVRRLSLELNLTSWNRPSSPCLSSRFPYGEPITIEALRRVEAAEDFLRSLGVGELRVRHHGDMARVEVRGEDIGEMLSPETRVKVVERFKALGYKFVTLDLEGFISGKMNGL